MDSVKRSLEESLKALRGPAMPEDVEARVRRRLAAHSPSPARRVAPRMFLRASYAQLALLLALLLVAGWVIRDRVMPTMRSLWERAHCLIDPSAGKADR